MDILFSPFIINISSLGDAFFMENDTRYVRTNHLIHSALIELLQKKSFDKITINDICNQALIGRSTFYHHYDDKYQLVSVMINATASEFNSLLNRRNVELNDDSLLIYLYRELSNKKLNFLALLSIKNVETTLEDKLKNILRNNSKTFLKNIHSNVPLDFLAELYATTALTSITWTLKNGYSGEIATFMNRSLNKIIETHSD